MSVTNNSRGSISLDEVFSIEKENEPEEEEEEVIVSQVVDSSPGVTIIPPGSTTNVEIIKLEDEELEKDYNNTRDIYDGLIKKGQEAIDDLSILAADIDSVRAYEALGGLIKSVKDVADQKLELHLKRKKIKEESKSVAKNVTNNAIFVGSTADLQRMLKKTNIKEITGE